MTLVIAALVLLLILVLVAVSAPVLTWSVAGIVVGVLGGWFTTLRGDR